MLSACTPHQIKSTKPMSLVPLNQVAAYQLQGKISFSDGQDGGSGRLDWQSDQGYIKALMKAPLGAKSWQLEEQVHGAQIIGAEGEVDFAESAEELISYQLGWSVPWQQLKSWIIGVPFDSSASRVKVVENGFSIAENGWLITYAKMKPYAEGDLPMKMVARKGNYSIKVAVRSWNW